MSRIVLKIPSLNKRIFIDQNFHNQFGSFVCWGDPAYSQIPFDEEMILTMGGHSFSVMRNKACADSFEEVKLTVSSQRELDDAEEFEEFVVATLMETEE